MPDPTRAPPGAIVLTEAQLRCLTSPTRREIFLTLGGLGPSSVARVASALGRPADGLYYHMRELVRVQLVHSRGQRAATTRPEEIFEAEPAWLTVDTENRDPGYLAARRKMVSSVVRTFGARAASALEEPPSGTGDARREPLLLRNHVVRLDDDAMAELDRRLAEIDVFVRDSALETGGRLVSVLTGRALDRPDDDERPAP